MICDPYICIKGPRAGTIEWFDDSDGFTCDSREPWERYADFEREKLRKLGWRYIGFGEDGYCRAGYTSGEMIGYISDDWENDSDMGRLLKRAEFLRKVCEAENVEWLPKEECRRHDCKELSIEESLNTFFDGIKKAIEQLHKPHRITQTGTFSAEHERDYYTKQEIDAKLKSICLCAGISVGLVKSYPFGQRCKWFL